MTSDPSPDWRDFEVEETGSESGYCECCGNTTKRVWGFVYRFGEPVGAYFVGWTQGMPDHGAAFDLILGDWSVSAADSDRYSVSLDFRLIDGSPQLMVVDADDRMPPGNDDSPFGTAFKRSDVIGTSLAAQVFAIVDAIYMSGSAVEVRPWSEN